MDGMDIKMVRMLQGDLPPGENPWLVLAETLGISEDEVVARLKALKASGKLKRVGAVLRHQNSGFTANGLAVFLPPEGKTAELGQKLAESPMISHCYERAPAPSWPYTLYAMIHGKTEEEISAFAEAFASKNSVESYEVLFSREELKKTSMVYFDGQKADAPARLRINNTIRKIPPASES